MKLKEFYNTVIGLGMEQDPRGKKAVTEYLDRLKARYKALKEEERKDFDLENLTNPYNDTRILNGDPDLEVKTILCGIDIEVGEIILADTLKKKGEKIDLVMSHHPSGRAYANFYEVMHMQADILNNIGIPINIAESLTNERIKEVERRVIALNHTRTQDAACLLNLAFICVHTPSDNFVSSYLQGLFDKKKPDTLKEVMNTLSDIPEYKESNKLNRPPKILIGSEHNRTGRLFVDMTGGTEGAKEIFEKMEIAGIGTLVCMHLSEEHFKKAKDAHMNVVIAGHISSDTLGLNLLLDEISKKENFKIISCSGFKRTRRK